MDDKELKPHRSRLHIALLPALIVVALALLTLFTYGLQHVIASDAATSGSKHASIIPSSFHDLQASASSLRDLARSHRALFVLVYCYAYAVKQTFCIPGSVLMNALGGVLFGVPLGLTLSVLMTTLGATGCYLVSLAWGMQLIECSRMEARVRALRATVTNAHARNQLLWYFLSLRLTTVFPQWLVNISAPHVGVPLPMFMLCTTVGTIPYNALGARAGALINDIQSMSDIFSWPIVLSLLVLALCVSLPALLAKRMDANGAGATEAPVAGTRRSASP